jgi:hypothetical protein
MSLASHEIFLSPSSMPVSAEAYMYEQHLEPLTRRFGLFVLMAAEKQQYSSRATAHLGAQVYAEGQTLYAASGSSEAGEWQTLRFPDVPLTGSAVAAEPVFNLLVVPAGVTVTGTWTALNRRRTAYGLETLPPLGPSATVQSLALCLRGQRVDGNSFGLVIGETNLKDGNNELKTLVDVRTGRVNRMLIASEKVVLPR